MQTILVNRISALIPPIFTKSQSLSSSEISFVQFVAMVRRSPKVLRKQFSNMLKLSDTAWLKSLNHGDVSKSRNRLAVSTSWVVEQVLPFFSDSAAARIERGGSKRVIFHDCDQDSLHVLYLKKLKTGRFVFVGEWKNDFVIRRNLKKGDKIGLCWKQDKCMFSFTTFYRN